MVKQILLERDNAWPIQASFHLLRIKKSAACQKNHAKPRNQCKNHSTITAAEKYSFDFLLFPSEAPRKVLNKTEPPIPTNNPRLYIMFQNGAMTDIAAVPSGP